MFRKQNQQSHCVALKRSQVQISISPTIWILSLEMARVCGWQPQGTQQVAAGDADTAGALDDVRHLLGWQTEYLFNDGQMVTAQDADSLADALCKAAVHADRFLTDWSEGRSPAPSDIRNAPNGFRWFNTIGGKSHLQSLCEFCRGGAFQIY